MNQHETRHKRSLADRDILEQILRDPADRSMREINARCADSKDFREVRRAFVEKRKLVFLGR